MKIFGLCRQQGNKTSPGRETENSTVANGMVVRPMDQPVSPEELRKFISVLQTYTASLNGSNYFFQHKLH